jgi:hypothetical protein
MGINRIMNKKSLLLCTGFVIICLSLLYCHQPKEDYPLKFEILNNSDSSIYFAFSDAFPDTSLSKIYPIPYYQGNLWQKLLPHTGKNEVTPDFNLHSKTFIFIFDANAIETTPWDTIVKHYNILKRYQLTKDDMEKLDWVITYP